MQSTLSYPKLILPVAIGKNGNEVVGKLCIASAGTVSSVLLTLDPFVGTGRV